MLINPGSGPTDRDGNNPLGSKAAPYRLLADQLAATDVSTVRIDKRGMFASAGAVPDIKAVTIEDYAHDVRAWIEAARHRPARSACDCSAKARADWLRSKLLSATRLSAD